VNDVKTQLSDVYKLTDTVNDVKTQLMNVQTVMKTMSQHTSLLSDKVAAHMTVNMHEMTVPVNHAVNHIGFEVPNHAGDSSQDASKSFADMFENKDDAADWFPKPVLKQLPRTRSVRKIVGTNRDTGQKVKAIPGTTEWHIFACRLEPTTTEAEMTAMLSDSHIKVVSCQLLEKKAQWQHKFAAFRIVVDIRDKDNEFNEVLWPVGADVRDWWFKPKSS